MKRVQVEMSGADVAIDFGGDWDGICCGPENRELLAKLAALGVEMTFVSVSCRLPANQAAVSVAAGDCVAGGNAAKKENDHG